MSKVKSAKVLAMLRRKRQSFMRSMSPAMGQAALFFIGDIQQTYYSGRPGLNVQNDTLRGGWNHTKVVTNDDVIVTIQPGPNAEKYARIHDKSRPQVFTPGRRTSTESAPFPARTDVIGRFNTKGRAMFMIELRDALRKWAKR